MVEKTYPMTLEEKEKLEKELEELKLVRRPVKLIDRPAPRNNPVPIVPAMAIT